MVFFLGVLFMTGCSGKNGATGPQGTQGITGSQGAQGITGPTVPVIQSLSVQGVPAMPGASVTATVIAQSSQELALTYTWTVTPAASWHIESGIAAQTATFTAPSGYSITGTATVMVSDTQGRYAIGAIALSTQGNSLPVINSISIYPQPVFTAANLVCAAYDPDGDALTYAWTVGGVPVTTGSNAQWYSPGIPGYYTVGISVNDGSGSIVNGSSSIAISSASPWPKFHDGIQSTGLSPINTSAITGTVKWKSHTNNSVYSSPAIGSDGTVYIGSQDNNVYALNPTDGSVKWKCPTGGFVNSSSPAIGADGTVYVGSEDNNVYALNPTDGSVKWKYPTGGPVDSSPAIGADGTVYVGSNDNYVYALNPTDGSVKWKYPTGGSVVSSPAIGADGTVYVGSDDDYVYALNPADGSVKWKYNAGIYVMSSPAIGADGTVYIGSFDGYVYALNPADGSVKWKYLTGFFVLSSPAIGPGGTLYVGSYDNFVYAIQ